MFDTQDETWMQRAIILAKEAAALGEVPVGAVLILDNELLAEGGNAPIRMQDPTQHAEIAVLRLAAKKLNNYRLLNTTLYVTLEPCMMCVGALVHARIKRLVFGAADLKSGAVVSCAQLLDQTFLNHRVSYQGGLLAKTCGHVLSEFFRARR
jgi:tRNA(adenine34) deaminase